MSRFVEMLLNTAATSERGIVTGEPKQAVRRAWSEVHQQAVGMAGALVRGTDTRPGLAPGAAVAVLAADPARSRRPCRPCGWPAAASRCCTSRPRVPTSADWARGHACGAGMIESELVLLGAPFDRWHRCSSEHGIDYRRCADLAGGEPLAEVVPSTRTPPRCCS